MNSTVLVVGGAGYIGSHMVKMLSRQGARVVTLDNLSTGHRDAVVAGNFIEGDLLLAGDLSRVFSAYPIDVVMHFAANCYVGESVQSPRKYYRNNVTGTLNLLDAMLDADVRKFVFSSSCATYGTPQDDLIDETQPQRPVNPYGRTKLVIEQVLADYARVYTFESVSLCYFNAVGSDPEGELGERHDPETHLIPMVLREALRVKNGGDPTVTLLRVYGDDFDTPDGTCVRDFVHVDDLCRAHLIALDRLLEARVERAEAFNLGIGRGYSVKEVMRFCREITGVDIRFQVEGRRAGDPPRLVANAAKAREVLGWVPEYRELGRIIETAWRHLVRPG